MATTNNTNDNYLRGIQYLDGIEHDGDVVYYADETASRWLVSAAEVVDLGEALAAGEPDAYSLWCANTSAQEIDPSDSQIRALRVECGMAGDSAGVAICERALEGDASAIVDVALMLDAAKAAADD